MSSSSSSSSATIPGSAASAARVPGGQDLVHNDECLYSFDSPFSPDGLYVSLAHGWRGVGARHLSAHSQRSGECLFLHLVKRKVRREEEEEEGGGAEDGQQQQQQQQKEEVVSKLALGVDGGFRLDEQKYEVRTVTADVVLLPAPGAAVDAEGVVRVSVLEKDGEQAQALPEMVRVACDAVMAHQSAASNLDEQAWEATEERPVSKYAEGLIQLDNGKKISNDPSTWRCEESGNTENIWLNLSTGHIGSGRRNWDGSGGTGAALRHYEETGGLYPLVVKLGTITPRGADVWSYAPDEDCLVTDPKLAERLSHWGIDIMQLEKTDKTLGEMEVDLNQSYQFDRITEKGEKLLPLTGAGFVGLTNLGNTCYMNAIMQTVFAIPEFAERYLANREAIFASAQDPTTDFATQMAKLAEGLLSDRYAMPIPEWELAAARAAIAVANGEGDAAAAEAAQKEAEDKKDEEDPNNTERFKVAPRVFKHVVAGNHPEFSTNYQQDAAEFFQHFLEVMTRNERVALPRFSGEGAPPSASWFSFDFEDRVECTETHQVRYIRRRDNLFSMQIPLEDAINTEQVEAYQERQRARAEQKEQQAEAKAGEGSNDTNKKPRTDAAGGSGDDSEEEVVLPIIPFDRVMERFMNAEMVPDYFSPSAGHNVVASKTVRFASFPRVLVIHLRRYYVDENWQAKKIDARIAMPDELNLTAFRSAGLQDGETAMPAGDSNEGANGGGAAAAAAPVEIDAEALATLQSFGFTEEQARAALTACDNNADRAAEWLFSHADDMDAAVAAVNAESGGGGDATGAGTGSGAPEVDAGSLATLQSFGFTEEQARAALLTSDNNADRAAEWLFSHGEDMDAAVAAVNAEMEARTAGGGGSGGDANALDDGEGRYQLMGFVSHSGRNISHGHYVCHLRKNGEWAIFDDRAVAQSRNTPLEFGYMYFYRRLN